MSAATPMGEAIDSLGMTLTLEPGDLIAGGIVVLKVVTVDGDVALKFAWSDGLAVFERIGMLRTAEAVETRDALE